MGAIESPLSAGFMMMMIGFVYSPFMTFIAELVRSFLHWWGWVVVNLIQNFFECGAPV